MKKIILSVFILFLTSILYSQSVSFVSGTEFPYRNGTFKYVIGEDKTSFYVLRYGTKGSGVQNNIEKYNKSTFDLEWVKDISFESDLGGGVAGNINQQSNVVLSGGKIYFFLSIVETRKNSRSVYVKSMSCVNGDVYGKAELLATEEKYGGLSPLGVSFSPDTSKALIQFKGIYSSTISKVKLIELKTNKELFDKEMPLSDDNGDLTCNSVSTDNKGNLLCIYSRTKGYPGLGKMAMNSTKLKTFDLNIEINDHAYLSSNILQYGDNFDNAVITGIFIDVPCKSKKTCEQREGNYYMKIDLNTSKVITSKYEYFDDAMHTLYKDIDYGGSYEKLACFNSIIDKSNDDVYSMSTNNYNGIIFVTRFSKDGKVIWTKAIPRNTMYYGFDYAFEKGILYFIYPDNPKNLETVPDVNNFSYKKVKAPAVAVANIVCMAITKDGTLTRSVIGKNEKGKGVFEPQYISNLSQETPIVRLDNKSKNREQFIRFEFQK